MRGQISDAELVRACRSGNADAWPCLVDRFSGYIYAIATQGYRLSDRDAEDVFQEVLTRTYEHLDRLRDDGAIRPWIAQLTRRLAIDHLRASAREQADEQALVVLDEQAGAELERLDEALTVRCAIDTMPEECREVLDRFFAQDQSYADISRALELPMGTIASRISRCLTKLRRELGD